jgi:hypothetical protein
MVIILVIVPDSATQLLLRKKKRRFQHQPSKDTKGRSAPSPPIVVSRDGEKKKKRMVTRVRIRDHTHTHTRSLQLITLSNSQFMTSSDLTLGSEPLPRRTLTITSSPVRIISTMGSLGIILLLLIIIIEAGIRGQADPRASKITLRTPIVPATVVAGRRMRLWMRQR